MPGEHQHRASDRVDDLPRDIAPGSADIGHATICLDVQPRLPQELEDRWGHAHVPRQSALVWELLQDSDPHTARKLAEAAAGMPDVGAEFLGFRLIAELGRGAFARVFLARQGDLAGRTVVLKITATADDEPQTLAQLQHTNIVPIYSVHRKDSLQAVCMPYFGATTLAAILRELRGRNSLPASGRDLIDTLVNGRTTVRNVAPRNTAQDAVPGQHASPVVPSAVEGRSVPESAFTLDTLKRFSYVDAVLWIGSRLAEGLAHAHERGILHRDLKPANVLLTDYGQPMLLDFNLAHDIKQYSLASALIGGTLPYMSPEQLRAYKTKDSKFLNFTSDIYSLGIILHELLTSRNPFDVDEFEVAPDLEKLIAIREQLRVDMRRWNTAVTPAVESIIRRCLAPHPAQRYRSALELKEDLDRQLNHMALRFAPEPSLRERLGKWMRRHPRLASSGSVAVLGLLLLIGLGALLAIRSDRIADLEANESLSRFENERRLVQFLLTSRTPDRADVAAGIQHGRQALDRYRVLDNPNWSQSAAVRRLPWDKRHHLQAHVGELLTLMSQSVASEAEHSSDSTRRHEQLQWAVTLNQRAESCLGADSRAVVAQRAWLLTLLGHDSQARELELRSRQLPLNSVRDYFLLAADDISHGRYRSAIPLLEEATRRDPENFWAWCMLGVCNDGLSQDQEAAACYSTCIALWPEFHWPYFNRGLAYLRQKNFKRAIDDFDAVLAKQPDFADAYVNRALAHQGREHYQAAMDDLTRALDLGTSHSRVYFIRARVRERLGDRSGAKQDRELGLRQVPADEKDWLARGVAQMTADPESALADFEQALVANPRSLAALQNKAYLFSRLGRNQDSLVVLNRVVDLYPDYVPARAGRAVILARLGRREDALKDTEECFSRDSKPATVYQLAGVYAQTSTRHPDDRWEAIRLLSSALRRGFGFDLIDGDKDLDPIRGHPEFRRLSDTVRAFQASPGPPTVNR